MAQFAIRNAVGSDDLNIVIRRAILGDFGGLQIPAGKSYATDL